MLGGVYHQGRNDVWAMTPRELDAYLEDWAKAKAKADQR
jgi:hypothetical protein